MPLGTSGTVTARHYVPDAPAPLAAVILAHGAGAGQRSPFMVSAAETLAGDGLDAITFDFPYMEQGRKLPDRAPVLEACYAAVIDTTRRLVPSARRCLFIGGKSMGGRMATQLAASDRSLPIAGIVLFGYPLHPPGKPERRRDAHLPAVARPMLVIQGSRDAFGTPDELRPVFGSLSPPAVLQVIEGGDHSFKVSGASASARKAVDAEVRRTAAEWMLSLAGASQPSPGLPG